MEIEINIPRRFWRDKIIKRRIPQTWHDIGSDKVRLRCLRIVALLNRMDARVQVLSLLLDLPKSVFLALSDDNITALSNHIEWIFAEPDTTPLIASFEHAGIRYHLPEKDFANGIAYEFALADDAYNEWLTDTKSPAPLILLVAILCREAKTQQSDIDKSGDIRIELLTEYQAQARAKQLTNLDFSVALAVLRYFQAVKKKVHESGVALGIFERPKPIQNPDDESNALHGWWTTFRNIAKTGVMGSEEQVWRVGFWRMFAFLQEEKKRADDMEADMKKTNNL